MASTGLAAALRGLKDYRLKPQIPLQTIVLTVMLKAFFELKSINQLDSFLKSKYAKKFFGSKRKMVCSASTIERTYRYTDPDSFRDILRQNAYHLNALGLWEGLRRKRILSIDGSFFGRLFAVCILVAGKAPCMLGYKPSKKGKEYTHALELLGEELSKLPKGHIHYVTADALYLRIRFFQILREYGTRGIVKYTPKPGKKRPTIVREVDKLINNNTPVDYTFTDKDRLQKVSMWVFNHRKLKGDTNEYFTVIKVREDKIKDEHARATEYYIIVDGDVSVSGKGRSLDLKQYRELAKGAARWMIEINGFKQMNQLFNSKRKYFKNSTAMENILTSIMLSFNLMNLYMHKYSKELFKNSIHRHRMCNHVLSQIHETLMKVRERRGLNLFDLVDSS